MPSQSDLIFGKIVVLNNLATEEQVRDCLARVDKSMAMGNNMTLPDVFLKQGMLNQEQINKVKSAADIHFKIREDQQYGKICIQQGFATQAQVQETLALQKSRNYQERLYQILLSKQIINSNQHQVVANILQNSRGDSSRQASPSSGQISRPSGQHPTPTPSQTPPPPAASSPAPGGGNNTSGGVDTDRFATVVLQQNIATQDQIQECRNIQEKLKAMGIRKDLAAVMQDKNYLSPQQAQQVRSIMSGGGNNTGGGAPQGQGQGQPQGGAPAPPPAAANKRKSPIEGYEIECKLGQGAMGVIYKAKHAKLQRVVALKVLLPEFANDKEFIQRFFREAKAAITLNHPHIIQGYHVGESNGFYYFAMEFVDGVTIKEKIEQFGLIKEEDAITSVIQVCRALEHAQEIGIVHRDIKPDNIMLTSANEAKLGDLGIAKEINQDGSLTQTGIALGTPYYISPEQAMGEKKIDIRSDIYSLGASFYHMVTGKVPYEGDTSAVIMTKHISEDPPDPRDVHPTVSQGLAEVIMKMMAKDRAYRYQSPAEIIEDLQQVKEKNNISFGSGSSVFIQDGLKIPKKSITRVSQIRSAPKVSGIRKSGIRSSGSVRGKRYQGGAYGQSSSSMPWLVGIAVGMLVIIAVLVFILFNL